MGVSAFDAGRARDVGTDCVPTDEWCDGVDQDCDGVVDEGELCAFPDAVGSCVDRECRLTECEPGRADCDEDEANGCEVDATADREHCGACGVLCAISERCEAGVCERERIVDLDASVGRVCAVLASGRMLCWGQNVYGGLGDGTQTNRSVPTEVAWFRDFVAAATGVGHTCAIRRSGEVWCWGNNRGAQLGVRPSYMDIDPVLIELPGIPIAIDAGMEFTCVILEDGAVWCWGDNGDGQLGRTITPYEPPHAVGIDGAVALALGENTLCVSRSDGTTLCAGRNHDWFLGVPGGLLERFVEVPHLYEARRPACGWMHACFLADSRLLCLGANENGQLGIGPREGVFPPTLVDSSASFVTVSALGHLTCAVDADSQVWCWGRNGRGAVGDGTTETRWSPTRVEGIRGTRVATGSVVACAYDDGSRRLWCWGYNVYGQTGSGTSGGEQLSPVPVMGFE